MNPGVVVIAVVAAVSIVVGVIASVLLDAEEINVYGPSAGSRKGIRRSVKAHRLAVAVASLIVVLAVVGLAVSR